MLDTIFHNVPCSGEDCTEVGATPQDEEDCKVGETSVGEKCMGEKYMVEQCWVKSIWVRSIWVKDGV